MRGAFGGTWHLGGHGAGARALAPARVLGDARAALLGAAREDVGALHQHVPGLQEPLARAHVVAMVRLLTARRASHLGGLVVLEEGGEGRGGGQAARYARREDGDRRAGGGQFGARGELGDDAHAPVVLRRERLEVLGLDEHLLVDLGELDSPSAVGTALDQLAVRAVELRPRLQAVDQDRDPDCEGGLGGHAEAVEHAERPVGVAPFLGRVVGVEGAHANHRARLVLVLEHLLVVAPNAAVGHLQLIQLGVRRVAVLFQRALDDGGPAEERLRRREVLRRRHERTRVWKRKRPRLDQQLRRRPAILAPRVS